MHISFHRCKILGKVMHDAGKQISHYFRRARDEKSKGKGRITKGQQHKL